MSAKYSTFNDVTLGNVFGGNIGFHNGFLIGGEISLCMVVSDGGIAPLWEIAASFFIAANCLSPTCNIGLAGA
eukprot:5090387-Ditylum_brightwellii.AAC.1